MRLSVKKIIPMNKKKIKRNPTVFARIMSANGTPLLPPLRW